MDAQNQTVAPVVVVVGPPGHGATTVLSHLMRPSYPERMLARLAQAAKERGGDPDTMLVDTLPNERSLRHTIRVRLLKVLIGTPAVIFVSVPGRPQYARTFIRAASMADVAVVVVSAKDLTSKDDAAILFNQALVLKAQEIEDVVVCITKLDLFGDETDAQQSAFESAKTFVVDLLTQHRFLRFDRHKVTVLPVNPKTGEGLARPFSWSQETTISDALKQFSDGGQRRMENCYRPFRMSIFESYKIGGIGTVTTGRQLAGEMKPGEMVVICPPDQNLWKKANRPHDPPESRLKPGQVFSLERFHAYFHVSLPGQMTAVNLKGLIPHQAPQGAVMVKASEIAEWKVEPTVMELLVRVQAVNACSQKRDVQKALATGHKLMLFAHNACVPCLVEQAVSILDSDNKAVGENRGSGGGDCDGVVQVGQVALVRLRPLKALVVEPHSVMASLGRIVVHDGKVPLAIGKVVSVVRRLKDKTASLVNSAHSSQCMAAVREHQEMVVARDGHHNNLLHLAAHDELGCHEIMAEVIEQMRRHHGEEELQRQLNLTNDDGLTPLHIALAAGNRKASAMLLANGALFQLSAGRGHNEGGYVKALTVRLPHVFRDAATGHNGPISLSLSCIYVLQTNRVNYLNLEESLPEMEFRKMAAAALHSFLARLAGPA